MANKPLPMASRASHFIATTNKPTKGGITIFLGRNFIVFAVHTCSAISIAGLKTWKRTMMDAFPEVTIMSYPENFLNLIATTLGT